MSTTQLQRRRENVFLIVAGIFLGAVTMLNIIGITRFIQLGPLALAIGVLPYPITFLCTDIISEIYGRKRANFVVFMGLGLNIFVLATLWLGQWLPAVPADAQPPWQVLSLAKDVPLPNGEILKGKVELFSLIYACTTGAVFASMVAYMAAQFCDIALFHRIKKLTGGRHLWLRNNGSTLVSQLVDSFMVISVTFGAAFFRGDMTLKILLGLMLSNYLFKMCAALVDTLPFYWTVNYLRKYLKVPKTSELG